MLCLAVQLVVAARQVAAFDTLELIQREHLNGRSIEEIVYAMLDSAVVAAAQR